MRHARKESPDSCSLSRPAVSTQHAQDERGKATRQHNQAPPTPPFQPGEPLVMQVGHLGTYYWTWVNQAETGQPRFFSHPSLEAITKTPWWIVPLVWTPVMLGAAVLALLRYAMHPQALLAYLIAGIVLWQLMEYCIHRFMFHAEASSYWGITLHFLFHGCHHKFPFDHERLVFPPVPAAVVVAIVYSFLVSLLPYGPGLSTFSGVMMGYVAYDCIHYALHHSSPIPQRLLAGLKSRHKKHHFRDHGKGYGISSVLFDVVFRTDVQQ